MRQFSFVPAAAVIALVAAASAVRAEDAVPLLHPESDVVVTFKMKEMLGRPVVQKYALPHLKAMLEHNEEVQKHLKAIGMDPMKDLDTVTLGFGMKDPQTPPSFSAVIDGKFDASKLAATAKSENVKTSEAGGKTMYEVPGQNGAPVYIAVVNDKRIYLSSEKPAVAAALAGDAKGLPKALVELVGKAEKDAVVSIVATKDLLSKLPLNPPEESKKMIDSIQNFMIQLKAGTDVDLSVTVGTGNSDAASQIAQMIAPQLAGIKDQADAMRNFIPPDFTRFAPLVDMVKTLQISSKDKKATITATLKDSVIEKVMKND